MMQRSVADLRAGGEASRAFLVDALRQQARMRLLAGDPAASLAAIAEADGQIAALASPLPEARRLMLELVRAAALARSGRTDDARRAYDASIDALVALGTDDVGLAEAHFGQGALAAPSDCAAAVRHLGEGRAALAKRSHVYAYLRDFEAALVDAIRTHGCGIAS
jgi:hypothetical protein